MILFILINLLLAQGSPNQVLMIIKQLMIPIIQIKLSFFGLFVKFQRKLK